MKKWWYQLFILCCFLCASCAVVVKQEKKLVIVNAGGSAEMPCYQSDSTYFYMAWYQQKPGKGLKMVVSSSGANDFKKEDDETEWDLKRDDTHNSQLILKSASKDDQAVYFCAARQGNDRQYFGQGTILSILGEGKEQINPNVTIFLPNKKEYTDHNLISLVCVASGFYPEHVRLHWSVNGVRRNDLYQNVVSNISDTFFTSKRLTLTRSEYFNQKNTFKCEAGFIGDSSVASAEIRGESACGVSEETYTMYINQGKISYIMVLFKSGLYALIVLAIIWRRKVLSGSC